MSPRDHVQSLARGLAVIEAFGRDHRSLSLSEVARRASVSRAAARRLLHTLVDLGYAATDGARFELRPRVLDLGFSYLSSMGVWDVARPHLETLVRQTQESCSAAVLEGWDIVHVVRLPARERVMTITVGVGDRLPAHATSMGRVLLSGLDDAALGSFLRHAPLQACTQRTITDPKALRRSIDRARRLGYAEVDGELELGLRSIAVPVKDRDGRIVGAFCLSTLSSRESRERTVRRLLAPLQACAGAIQASLARLDTVAAFSSAKIRGGPAPAKR